MKPIVRQILNERAKAKQVDMMLNPPDVIAGGPGSGRKPGAGKTDKNFYSKKEMREEYKAQSFESKGDKHTEKAQAAFENFNDKKAKQEQKKADAAYRKAEKIRAKHRVK